MGFFLCPNCRQKSIEVFQFTIFKEDDVYILCLYNVGNKMIKTGGLVKSSVHKRKYYQCINCGYVVGGDDELKKHILMG